ncbi:MAG: hypothetical protein PF542_02505 [Nanoarchaeota archaeon]|jgi:hypothetical protein|nr:hypothetical protein [Nanoarchaeota archaeon]
MKLEFKYGCPDEMENKTLVDYLTDNNWSSSIKTNNNHIAISFPDKKRIISSDDSNKAITRYKIVPEEKRLYIEKGFSVRNPYYNAQKAQIHIQATNNNDSPITEQDILQEFIAKGYSIKE